MIRRLADIETLMANPDGSKRGPSGRRRCRWCGTETKHPRRTWCSDECVHEWKSRSNPRYARHCVWQRDRGRCALCGLDCTALKRQLRNLKRRLGFAHLRAVARILGIRGYSEGTLWDADHTVPVIEGGWRLGLENLRTLCRWCHRGETRKLRARLREAKRPCRQPSKSRPPSAPSQRKRSGSTGRARSKASVESRSRKR